MLQYLLPPNRKEALRKKLRGLKQYFRQVFSQADSCRLDVSDSDWYDFWHYHPDRYGYGNLNWPMRARHSEALAKVFDRYAQQLHEFKKPYQLWIWLDIRNASQDAVFVHSPNPNHDDFPLVVDGAEWGISEVSQHFEGLLPGYRLRAGRFGESDSYFVYCPDVGLSIERANP